MQCSNCMSLLLSLFSPLSLSWPLYLAFSFRVVISRGSELHGSAERAQRWEQFANSLSETRTRQADWTVRDRAGEPVRFGSLPPFHRSRSIALPRPTKHADWFLYFYIKRPFHRVRCDTHRLRSFLFTSGPSASLLVSFLFSSLSLSLSFVPRQQIDTELRGAGNMKLDKGEGKGEENPEGDR